MIFNKSLHPDDYTDPVLVEYIKIFNDLRGDIPASIQHPHRKWEYCIALAAVDYGLKDWCVDLLEVGSGGSLFAPLAVRLGYDVVIVDPEDSVQLAARQDSTIKIVQEDFFEFETGDKINLHDAVVCLSVIEHVENDIEFFQKLLKHTHRILFLTTDFSMTGEQFVPHHLRTYSPHDLQNLTDIANSMGFVLLDEPQWIDNGSRVFDYNFASLCLVRKQYAL